MKKSELKTGMVVECRSGQRAVVILDNCLQEDCIVFSDNNWTGLDNHSEDLIWFAEEPDRAEHTKSVDIMKVYKPALGCDFLSFSNGFKSTIGSGGTEHKLLWEREEVVEMTMAQLCVKLGMQIKIIE